MNLFKKSITVISFMSLALLFTCFDAKRNNPYDPVNGSGIFQADFYVSIDRGNDTNDGSASSPFATIQKAVNDAELGYKIAVEQGTYNIIGSFNVGGIELYGGFPDNGSWSNRVTTNETIINDQKISTGTNHWDPVAALFLTPNTDNLTVIDGFVINGGTGKYTSAIKINSGQSGTVVISRNKIFGGNAALYSRGVFLYNNTSFAGTVNIKILSNSIDGGHCESDTSETHSYGICLQDNISAVFNIAVINNTIDGGYANSKFTAMYAYTYGIYCYNLSPKIFNNTIDGGYSAALDIPSECYGIYLSNNSDPMIINNIIFASLGDSRYGIYEDENTSDPTQIENNDVFAVNTALYFDFDIDDANTPGDGNLNDITAAGTPIGNFYNPAGPYSLNPPAVGNVKITPAPGFETSDDWHLPSGTDPKVYAGGQVITDDDFPKNNSGNPVDKDGNVRTGTGVGWSMGAYELDN